jgi:hypothetical protein
VVYSTLVEVSWMGRGGVSTPVGELLLFTVTKIDVVEYVD